MIISDPLDKKIIVLLKRDGRMSNREIGRELKVSEGTVRNRLRRLYDSKAFRLTAVIGTRGAGLAAVAFVRMLVIPSDVRRVAQEASTFSEISFVGLTMGRYNLIAIVQHQTREDLAVFIHHKLALLSGVLAIDTREIVRSMKYRFDRVRIT